MRQRCDLFTSTLMIRIQMNGGDIDLRRKRLRSSAIDQLERSNGWSGLKRLSVRSTLMSSFSLKCGTGLWRTASGLLIVSERR